MKKVIYLLFLLPISGFGQKIALEDAQADVLAFYDLLHRHSSYYHLDQTNEVVESAFVELREELAQQDSIPIIQLTYALEKVMALIPDRHASVKFRDFDEEEIDICNYHFPVALARYKNKLVALKSTAEKHQYAFYNEAFPYVKAINDIPIATFIDQYAYRRKHAPLKSKLTRSAKDIRDIGELFFKQGQMNEKNIQITFANENGKTHQEEFSLTKDKKKWRDIALKKNARLTYNLLLEKPIDFEALFTMRADGIGVFTIPKMVGEADYPGISQFIKKQLDLCKKAKGVVIDLRNNGGGNREILQLFAPYLIQPQESPWVANVAFVRSDQNLDEDIASMSGRFLFNYYSEAFNEQDRAAIDIFKSKFKAKAQFDATKFSTPYYMVLRSNRQGLTCPVYILGNENCFSAASVFITALKGLSNVKIVGTNSDGSSGRSKVVYLNRSNIRVKLSTMISLQSNGYPLDAYGTKPDIMIDRDLDQLLGKKDTQLEKTIALIKAHK